MFNGERAKFRDWNDKLLNALAQVKPGYRPALKMLNKKLETLEGVIPEEDEDDIIRIMNGRLTAYEFMKASQAKQKEDEDKGDYEFTEEEKAQMGEDLWYILNEKLEGAEARGKLKGLTDGDGRFTSGILQSLGQHFQSRCHRR